MRKNGSRLISVKQYRLTDLFLFALILAVGEISVHMAAVWLSDGAMFTVSLMLPIVLLVMMRWGWWSIPYAAAAGLITCLLDSANGLQYASYVIGNAFVGIALIPLHFIGKDKVASRWWTSALFVIVGWLCVYLGRSVVWAIGSAISPVEGTHAYDGFVAFALNDVFSLVMAIVIIMVMRRLDGMFVDQRAYLQRVDDDRQKKQRGSMYGDQLAELDDEALQILNKDDDVW